MTDRSSHTKLDAPTKAAHKLEKAKQKLIKDNEKHMAKITALQQQVERNAFPSPHGETVKKSRKRKADAAGPIQNGSTEPTKPKRQRKPKLAATTASSDKPKNGKSQSQAPKVDKNTQQHFAAMSSDLASHLYDFLMNANSIMVTKHEGAPQWHTVANP